MITRDNRTHPHLHIDGVYTQKDTEGGDYRVVLRGLDTADERDNDVALLEDLDGIGLVSDIHGYAPLPLWAFESMWEWSGTSSKAPSTERLQQLAEGTAVVKERRRRRKAKRAEATGERRLSPSGDGEVRFDHNQEMLSRAFGLSDEWYHNTDALIEELYQESDKMTQVAVRLVKEVRAEELGIDHLGDFSDYEMKLFYSGFMLAQMAAHKRHREALMSAFMAATLSDEEKSEDGIDPLGGILGGLDDLLRQLKKRKEEDDEDNSDDTRG